MKIMILKFARGGSQIGGEYAQYSASYTPLDVEPLILKSTATSNSSSKSSSKDSNDITLKDIFKVFDNVKGITSDVNYVIEDFVNMVRGRLLTSPTGELDITTLATLYGSNLAKFNMLANSYNEFNNIRERLEKANSLDEVAVDSNGNLIVLTGEGIDKMSPQEYLNTRGAAKALTNHELLDLRDKNRSFAFRDDIYGNISGVGMDGVLNKINNIVKSIGSTKKELTSDTMRTILKGIEFIQEANELGVDLAQGSEMIIRNELATEDQLQQAQAAISAIVESLNPQELALIAYHSVGNGGKGLFGYLTNLIGSKTSGSIKLSLIISRIFTPAGAKSSTTKKEGTDKGDTDKSNQLMLMQQMQGGVHRTISWVTKDGTQSMGTSGIYYPHIENIKGDMSLETMLNESGMAGILQSFGGITFGDLKVPFNNLKDIMYENLGGYVTILPATTDEQGNRVVDLSIMDTYKKIVNGLTEPKGSEAWKLALARKLKLEGLSLYIMGDGQLDDKRFGLFFIATGYTTDKWNFKKDSKWVEKYNSADKSFEQRMSRALSTDEKKSNYGVDIDDKPGWFEGFWDDIYRGTIYIPIDFNINAAINAHGDLVSIESARRYERDYLVRDKVQGANTQIGSDVLQLQ